MQSDVLRQQRILSAVDAVVAAKAESAVNGLIRDERITRKLQEKPFLMQVLRSGVLAGRIGDVQDGLQALSRTEIEGRISDALLSGRPAPRRSRTRAEMDTRDGLIAIFDRQRAYRDLSTDHVFRVYLRKMGKTIHRMGLTIEAIEANTLIADAVISHICCEYELIRVTGLPTSLLKTCAHSLTVFQINDTYLEAERVFGRDEWTKPLIRTAASLVLRKQYKSVEAAKESYDKILEDADGRFGNDDWSKSVARTAAGLVFGKRYESVEAAKESYDKILEDANGRFGNDDWSKSVARTAALFVFEKKYKSVEAAKGLYDKILEDADGRFGNDDWSKSVARTAAGLVFGKRYESVEAAKESYDKILEDANGRFGNDDWSKSVARTAALFVFEKKYKSVEAAKEVYGLYTAVAEREVGGGPDLRSVVAGIVHGAFRMDYPSIEEALKAHGVKVQDGTG